MIFNRDAFPERPTTVGLCIVCEGTVTTEDEHEQFGLKINDCLHRDCERRKVNRRTAERRKGGA